VGMENFNILFNKYFKAGYYSLAPTETFFDRAHNQFLNLMAESGVLALLVYLGFPLFIIFYLFKGYGQGKFELWELLIFSSASVAYFIHLFFVFDDINSFLFFLVLIAFIEFKYNRDNLVAVDDGGKSGRLNNFAVISLVLAAVITIYSAYNFNYKVFKAANISALAYMSPNFSDTIKYYNQALDLNIIQEENVAVNYGDYLADWSNELDKVKADKNNSELFSQAVKKVREAFDREIKLKPADAFLYMKLAKINNLEYLFYNDKKYIDQATSNLKQGIILSPERLQLYYILGESYIISDQASSAVEILKEALNLNPEFADSYYYLGRAYLAAGQLNQAYDYIITQAIESRKYNPPNSLILLALAQEYGDKNDYEKMINIDKIILKLEPANAKIYATLAAAYLQTDQYDLAIGAAVKAAEADSSYRTETDLFIEMIKSGQTEKLKQATK